MFTITVKGVGEVAPIASSVSVPVVSSLVPQTPLATVATTVLAPLTLGLSSVFGELFGGGMGFDWGGAENQAAGQQISDMVNMKNQEIKSLIESRNAELKSLVDQINIELANIPSIPNKEAISRMQYNLTQMLDIQIVGVMQETKGAFNQIQQQVGEYISQQMKAEVV